MKLSSSVGGGLTDRVTGVIEVDLSRLVRVVEEAKLTPILKRAVEPIAAAMRAHAPVKTGALRKSIKVRVKRGFGFLKVLVGPHHSLFHIARFNEYGASGRPGIPFIRPAIDANEGRALKEVEAGIDREIAAAVGGLAP